MSLPMIRGGGLGARGAVHKAARPTAITATDGAACGFMVPPVFVIGRPEGRPRRERVLQDDMAAEPGLQPVQSRAATIRRNLQHVLSSLPLSPAPTRSVWRNRTRRRP